MTSPRQLALPLRLPPEIVLASRLAESMHCAVYRLTMPRSQCIATQAPPQGWPPGATADAKPLMRRDDTGRRLIPDPYCASGKCRQGLAVLLEERLLERARCDHCAGCGWIPRVRRVTSARAKMKRNVQPGVVA